MGINLPSSVYITLTSDISWFQVFLPKGEKFTDLDYKGRLLDRNSTRNGGLMESQNTKEAPVKGLEGAQPCYEVCMTMPHYQRPRMVKRMIMLAIRARPCIPSNCQFLLVF